MAPALKPARQRLSAADLMARLADEALALAGRMQSPARHHREAVDRIDEAERIATEIRKVVRG